MDIITTVKWVNGNDSANDCIIRYCKENNIDFRYNHYFNLEIFMRGEWKGTDYKCNCEDMQILIK